jgi:hypothetical protein
MVFPYPKGFYNKVVGFLVMDILHISCMDIL